MITAERLVQIGGLTAFAVTLHWLYSRELREKYAMGWMLTASGLLILGIFPRLIMVFADASRLAYPSAVLFVALAVVYIFSMGISVTLTWQRRATVRLTQELALLRLRIDQLEARGLASEDHEGEEAALCWRRSETEPGLCAEGERGMPIAAPSVPRSMGHCAYEIDGTLHAAEGDIG